MQSTLAIFAIRNYNRTIFLSKHAKLSQNNIFLTALVTTTSPPTPSPSHQHHQFWHLLHSCKLLLKCVGFEKCSLINMVLMEWKQWLCVQWIQMLVKNYRRVNFPKTCQSIRKRNDKCLNLCQYRSDVSSTQVLWNTDIDLGRALSWLKCKSFWHRSSCFEGSTAINTVFITISFLDI